MSSKILTTGANFYPTDSSPGWDNSQGNTAITDGSDATFWGMTSSQIITRSGSVQFAEDLAAQVPWNSTVASVAVTIRSTSGISGGGKQGNEYVQNIATASRLDGAVHPILNFVVNSNTTTFNTDSDAGAWTVAKVYNTYKFGFTGAFTLTSGGVSLAWLKISIAVNFTLPAPTVTTGGSTSVGGSSATVMGTVNANHTFNSVGTDGYPVTVVVEWGTTTGYGTTTSAGTATGGSVTPFSVTLNNLVANNTYHYRFKATDGDNTVVGLDQTFVTTVGDPILISS